MISSPSIGIWPLESGVNHQGDIAGFSTGTCYGIQLPISMIFMEDWTWLNYEQLQGSRIPDGFRRFLWIMTFTILSVLSYSNFSSDFYMDPISDPSTLRHSEEVELPPLVGSGLWWSERLWEEEGTGEVRGSSEPAVESRRASSDD